MLLYSTVFSLSFSTSVRLTMIEAGVLVFKYHAYDLGVWWACSAGGQGGLGV